MCLYIALNCGVFTYKLKVRVTMRKQPSRTSVISTSGLAKAALFVLGLCFVYGLLVIVFGMLDKSTQTFLAHNLNAITIGFILVVIFVYIVKILKDLQKYIKDNPREAGAIANYLSNKIVPVILVVGAIILLWYLLGLGLTKN